MIYVYIYTGKIPKSLFCTFLFDSQASYFHICFRFQDDNKHTEIHLRYSNKSVIYILSSVITVEVIHLPWLEGTLRRAFPQVANVRLPAAEVFNSTD